MNDFDPNLNIEYPKIMISKKDIKLAYKLLDIYSGNISELTQIQMYSYQSIYLNKYTDLSNILNSISKIETKHLKILGILISKLGLIPYFVTYKDNCAIPWNSDYVNFTTDYRSMLINNINSEVEAIKLYNEIIKDTDDTYIINIIQRIIKDEEKHIEIFNKLLKQYDEDI